MEHNHSSSKRQALQLSQVPLMPQIRPPLKVADQFDDRDVLDLYSSSSDESDGSDVSDDSETDTDSEALFNPRNDAGDQNIVRLEWHPDGGKSLRDLDHEPRHTAIKNVRPVFSVKHLNTTP